MDDFESRVRAKWSKLSEADLKAIRGNWLDLPIRLQKVYGYRWEQAEAEFNAFKETLQPEWNLNKKDRTSPYPDKASLGDEYGDEHHDI